MKKNDKEIKVNYNSKLIETSNKFLIKKLSIFESMHTGQLIDITLSAHLSSCFTMMTYIAESSDNKTILVEVNKFIRKMEDILPAIIPFGKVEVSK
jgi:hypothetical protein